MAANGGCVDLRTVGGDLILDDCGWQNVASGTFGLISYASAAGDITLTNCDSGIDGRLIYIVSGAGAILLRGGTLNEDGECARIRGAMTSFTVQNATVGTIKADAATIGLWNLDRATVVGGTYGIQLNSTSNVSSVVLTDTSIASTGYWAACYIEAYADVTMSNVDISAEHGTGLHLGVESVNGASTNANPLDDVCLTDVSVNVSGTGHACLLALGCGDVTVRRMTVRGGDLGVCLKSEGTGTESWDIEYLTVYGDAHVHGGIFLAGCQNAAIRHATVVSNHSALYFNSNQKGTSCENNRVEDCIFVSIRGYAINVSQSSGPKLSRP